jgi:hypothetical protein
MSAVVQMLVAGIISAGTKVLGVMFGEKVLVRVFLSLGDKITSSTKNTLDDDVWKTVRQELDK